MWNGNLALFMAEAGLEARARGYLDRVAACDDAELTRNVDGRSAAALAAEACALLADERLAPRLYELLLPRDGLCILGGRGVYFRGAAARYLGLLAATLGRTTPFGIRGRPADKQRAQAPPWIARSQLDLGRALLARGGPGTTTSRGGPAAARRTLAPSWGCRGRGRRQSSPRRWCRSAVPISPPGGGRPQAGAADRDILVSRVERRSGLLGHRRLGEPGVALDAVERATEDDLRERAPDVGERGPELVVAQRRIRLPHQHRLVEPAAAQIAAELAYLRQVEAKQLLARFGPPEPALVGRR